MNPFDSNYIAPKLIQEDQIFRLQTRGSTPQYQLPTQDSPSFGDVVSAQLGYTYAPLIDATINAIRFRDEEDPDYDSTRDMIGYEEYAVDLIDAKNEEHMRELKKEIDENKERRQVLLESSIPKQLIAGIFDPINLVALPFGGFALGPTRAALKVGTQVAGLQVGLEAARLPFDPLGTVEESFGNVAMAFGGGAIIGGAVGAVMSKRVAALKQLEKESIDLIKQTEKGPDKTLLQKAKDSGKERPFEITKEVKINKKGDAEPVYTNEYLIGLKNALPLERFGNEKRLANLKAKNADVYAAELKGLNQRKAELETKNKSPKITEEQKQTNLNTIKDINKQIELGNSYNKTLDDIESNQKILSQIDAELAVRRVDEDAQKNVGLQDPMALEKNWFTDSFIYKAIPTPIKTVLQDSKIPTVIKEAMYNLIGDSGMNLVKTKFGLVSENSVYQLSKIREGEWVAVHDLLRTIYKEQYGKNLYAMDIDVDDIVSRVRKKTTYHDWLSETYQKILKEEPLTDIEKRVKGQIDGFMQRWEKRLRDEGIIGDVKSLQKEVNAKNLRVYRDVKELQEIAVLNKQAQDKYDVILKDLNDRFMGVGDKIGLTPKQIEFLESLKLQQKKGVFLSKNMQFKKNALIRRIQRNSNELIDLDANLKIAKETPVLPANEEFFFPRYWSADKIKENREKFAQILTDWFISNPTITIKNAKGLTERVPARTPDEIIRATNPKSVQERVDSVIKKLTNEATDLTDDSVAFYGYGKSKHFRHRELDIPNKLVTDFIETNPVQVMRIYTQRVAPKYEFSKKYGGRSIDDVLDDLDDDMLKAGRSESEINKLRKNFLHSYDRVVGRVLTDPTRLDLRFANMLRDLAQLNYLGSAGISSIPDVAKVFMEHEMKNVFKGLYGILSDSKVRMTRKELRVAAEALEILQGDAHMKYVEDLTNNPLESGFRTKARSAFYILNGLAPITNIIKKLDGIIRQHELIEFAIKDANGTATSKDIMYLRRYGIDKQASIEISNANWEKSDSGMYLANTEKWTTSQETLDKFRVAINSGVSNTVVMGTPADKPIIADGVAYIPSWIGKKFGMKEDARYRGYSRIETGLAGLPFQFWSYSFAAANKITAAMATGQAKNRAIAAITAMGLGYMSLSIKYDLAGTSYIWDKMSIEDKMARSFDSSGLGAMYSDLFYTSMQTSLALGGPDISMGLLQPKFPQEKSYVDAFTGIGGAGPSIGYDLAEGAYKFAVDGDMNGASQFIKNLPYMRLWFIRDEMNQLGRMLQDTDEGDINRILRNRF